MAKFIVRQIASPRFRLLLGAVVMTASARSVAGQDPGVARFPILESPIGLVEAVRSNEYLGVIGRAAAWLGTETGPAELWVHPLKLANEFTLDFRIPDYVDPIRGEDVARTVEVRPEATTITYSHATFTVRQHIIAPLNDPGLIVLLDVETFRNLEIVVSFKTVFQLAWPAAFGGQYTFWDEGLNAFVLSESRRRHNAIIGSPWAGQASAHPAHALPDAPSTFVIAVDSARATREFIPIVVAADLESRDEAIAVYRRLLGDAEGVYRERREHAERLLRSTTSVDTPDDRLDLAFEWSKINLDEQTVCNPDLGCGLVAGWGMSGASARPGFGWFFGGDAAINSLAMDATGMWSPVAEGLRFLARYQREDGKITHEISQSAARIPWFDDYPYAFIHADTTPYWIVAVWRYWRASGDDDLLRELWPAIRRAYEWCLSTETDGDGIIENTTGGLGAVEVGQLREEIHQDIYLAGVWVAALEALSDIAAYLGDARLAGEANDLFGRARLSLNDRYWMPDAGYHAYAINSAGGTNAVLTVWPTTAMAFRLIDRQRADATLTKLAADRISADWGTRIVSAESDLYDPMHYNNGAIWPFVTGFVAWSQYNYRRPWSGYHLIDAVGQITFDWSRGRHAELLSGNFYRPLDTAVPQQFFASSMFVSPFISGMLGWEPDAPRSRARLAPQLRPDWGVVVVSNLRVGETSLDVAIERGNHEINVTIQPDGPAVEVDLVIALPAGATDPVATVNGAGLEGAVAAASDGDRLSLALSVTAEQAIAVQWSGGLDLVPPARELDPGQTSSGLRVLDWAADGAAWQMVVEGSAGQSYSLELVGQEHLQSDTGEMEAVGPGKSRLSFTMPAGTGRVSSTIRVTER